MRLRPATLDAPSAIRQEMVHFGSSDAEIRRVLLHLARHGQVRDCAGLSGIEAAHYDAIAEACRPGFELAAGMLRKPYVRPAWLAEA